MGGKLKHSYKPASIRSVCKNLRAYCGRFWPSQSGKYGDKGLAEASIRSVCKNLRADCGRFWHSQSGKYGDIGLAEKIATLARNQSNESEQICFWPSPSRALLLLRY